MNRGPRALYLGLEKNEQQNFVKIFQIKAKSFRDNWIFFKIFFWFGLMFSFAAPSKFGLHRSHSLPWIFMSASS